MFEREEPSIRTHDLLEIDAGRFLLVDPSTPGWVGETLRRTPFVVVRRGPVSAQEIPVGVRGACRSERWAAVCHPSMVRGIMTPGQLLRRPVPVSRAATIPALRALQILAERWQDLDLSWGPGGSVGYELATGTHAVTPQSDLDVVVYAKSRLTPDEARTLCDSTTDLPAPADIRVETPVCGFSLVEFADRSPAPILLRVPSGVVLGIDPWIESSTEAAAREAGPRA
jgi:phosphoribosyl-dephospho-CoA transferase